MGFLMNSEGIEINWFAWIRLTLETKLRDDPLEALQNWNSFLTSLGLQGGFLRLTGESDVRSCKLISFTNIVHRNEGSSRTKKIKQGFVRDFVKA